MLTSIGYPIFLLQLPLAQAEQLLLVTGISFVVITLIYSTCRFQTMINFSGKDLQTVQDCNDFFFIQVTRYLSRINRSAAGFGLIIVQFRTDAEEKRKVQDQLVEYLTDFTRKKTDKICLFRKDCAAAIIDTGNENVTAVANRIVTELSGGLNDIPEITAVKAGASAYPVNGSSSQEIIDCATDAMDSAGFDMTPLPLCIAEIKEEDTEAGEHLPPQEEQTGDDQSQQDKKSSLDALTGVLKPDVVGSYMRKYLSELRYQKQSVSVLCVGVNRIDEILSLHGKDAADSIMAGVSQILQDFTRESDLIGRFQRDDFLLLIPTPIKEGEKIAVRLREAVQNHRFSFDGKPLKTSISIGITGYPEHGRLLRDLFRGSYAALEIIRDWDTSACLIYDPAHHDKKVRYAKLPT